MYNLFYRIYINYIVKWLSVSSSRFRLHFDNNCANEAERRSTLLRLIVTMHCRFFLVREPWETIIPIASSKIEFALLFYLTNCQNFR